MSRDAQGVRALFHAFTHSLELVKFHLSNIYRKLGVGNCTEASRWAQVHGLLASEQSDTSAHGAR